jgi:hypothetical protein
VSPFVAAAAAAPCSSGESGRPSLLVDRTQNEASARGDKSRRRQRNPGHGHQWQQRMLGHARQQPQQSQQSLVRCYAAATKPARRSRFAAPGLSSSAGSAGAVGTEMASGG